LMEETKRREQNKSCHVETTRPRASHRPLQEKKKSWLASCAFFDHSTTQRIVRALLPRRGNDARSLRCLPARAPTSKVQLTHRFVIRTRRYDVSFLSSCTQPLETAAMASRYDQGRAWTNARKKGSGRSLKA
jgi:hypothetical protein